MAEWVAPGSGPSRVQSWSARGTGRDHTVGSGPADTASRTTVDPAIWREHGRPLVRAEAIGPLTGAEVAVKDLFAVAGHRRGAGVPGWLAEAAPETTHADALERLLAAGATVRGITHADEFGYGMVGRNAHYGTPPNAAVPGAVPGGSSSGTAAAVGLGLADVGLGTDTAGSVRIPASYQGLWGLRTSHGRVPTVGVLPLAPSFDTVGLLTRTADVLAAATHALLGTATDARRGDAAEDDPEPGTFPLVVDTDALAAVSDPVRALFRAALQRIAADAGLGPVEPVRLGDPGTRAECFRVVQAAEAWRAHGRWVATHPGALGPDVSERFAVAADVDPGTEQRARARAAELRGCLDERLDGRVLLLPTAPSPAPPLTSNAAELNDVRRGILRLTSIAGLGGYPALSVPSLVITTLHASAPVGLCLVGPRGSDLALIALGRRIDQALK
ncbi:Asp-tRNA(Asn)/Glu-tRNA(Gln) amidotransferase A subunit family amidase [Friedmanniella endophytica]|uniref:Asp-tRNA(Asn)/Glu-tRNA(Gln) amidotransferase A subunit family amidase n=1 Tax=Microlunatus kandeliicorticis TaxID=1759536 RepID=A0A7W3IV85_9ACTN|nr:amidase family protein [Microlunatus kandeliicorticis]MBA8795862.1 Asp-tRNA(Asn)/Glu-tRNA(Gln) amidotransferase A subunit family amidase [Microlunatus kandeliicorticis]